MQNCENLDWKLNVDTCKSLIFYKNLDHMILLRYGLMISCQIFFSNHEQPHHLCNYLHFSFKKIQTFLSIEDYLKSIRSWDLEIWIDNLLLNHFLKSWLLELPKHLISTLLRKGTTFLLVQDCLKSVRS